MSHPQVSWDSRRFSERMRRGQLYRALDYFNIPYPSGAPATKMRTLLEGSGVSDQELMDFCQKDAGVQVVEGKDEHGNPHREYYPSVPAHETARLRDRGVEINYEAIIAQNAQEAEQREAVIDDQADVIKAMAARLEALESQAKGAVLPLQSLTPFQLKKVAKDRGIDVKGLTKKVDLLAALED